MFLLIAAANPLFNHRGVTMLFLLFDQWFTLEAVCYGLVSAASLSAVIFWFSCYQTVMTSDKFLFLFGKLAPNVALLITMTLGLLPRLHERSAQIRTAQTLLAPEKKRLLPRLQAANRNLSALLTWSMENAVQTADSMKARGYGVRRRTTFHLFVLTAATRRCWVLFWRWQAYARSGARSVTARWNSIPAWTRCLPAQAARCYTARSRFWYSSPQFSKQRRS